MKTESFPNCKRIKYLHKNTSKRQKIFAKGRTVYKRYKLPVKDRHYLPTETICNRQKFYVRYIFCKRENSAIRKKSGNVNDVAFLFVFFVV